MLSSYAINRYTTVQKSVMVETRGKNRMTLKNNEMIGDYLDKLILKQYPSKRQFCIAYLRESGGIDNNEEVNKMANRMSQITKGKKAIQVYDLPIFCKLLSVSCEQILSAGETFVPDNNRVTNYSVALSKNTKEWQDYIDREDKLILNYDEYGKSVLDYAIEFENYGFLKYLTDKGYIKFHDSADSNYSYNFGAETPIKRRNIFEADVLQADTAYSDKLRTNMLTLAMKNKDYSVLDMLRARETPMLTFAAHYSNVSREPEGYDCLEIVESIASAPDEILEYFLKEYSVLKKGEKTPSCFLYQHLGKVISTMIEKGDKRVIRVIKRAIAHNEKVDALIKEVYSDAVQNAVKECGVLEEKAKELVIPFKEFHETCDVVRAFCAHTNKSVIANVIRADVKTDNPEIWRLISLLNGSYDNVRVIKNEEDD